MTSPTAQRSVIERARELRERAILVTYHDDEQALGVYTNDGPDRLIAEEAYQRLAVNVLPALLEVLEEVLENDPDAAYDSNRPVAAALAALERELPK